MNDLEINVKVTDDIFYSRSMSRSFENITSKSLILRIYL